MGAGFHPESSPLRGFLFGAGHILYDATLWRRWLLQLLRRIGVDTHYRTFFRDWDADFLPDVHRGRREFCEAFEAFLLQNGLSRAQIDEVEAACHAQRSQWETNARPLPGVKSTLTRLHAAGITLGVLSDCELPSDALAKRLQRFGLHGLFSTVVSSLDVENTKPHPLGYLAALGAMKTTPQETAFVGHHAQELAGAARLGMRTVAFNFDPEVRADFLIARFEELLDLAGQATQRAAAG
jgi:HAD superfamily hydrolase (TIGR01509 family)